MRNLFLPEGTKTSPAETERTTKPVSVHYAVAVDGANAVQPPNRAMRRKGITFLREPASKPARHGICRATGRRTWISRAGYSRQAFLDGEGDVGEVSFS